MGLYLGKVIYKLTGYMTKKELIRRARTVGIYASSKIKETGKNPSSDEISEILGKVIGKKAAAKIEVSGDKASLVEALIKNLGIPKMHAENVANNCLSAALGKGIGSKSHLNLQVSDMPFFGSVNIISHETEHVLHRTLSFDVIIPKLLEKTSLGRKLIQKNMEKAPLLNEKNILLQTGMIKLTGWRNAIEGVIPKSSRSEALLEITKCSDKKMLQKKIKDLLYTDRIIEIGNDKQNNFILKSLIAGLKDESRAYNAGAYVEDLCRQTAQNGSQAVITKSQIIADIYDETIRVMKNERKHIQSNRLKEFFGFKANRKIEKEIVDSPLKYKKLEIPKKIGKDISETNGLNSEKIKKVLSRSQVEISNLTN